MSAKKPHHGYYSKKSKLTFCRKCGLVWLKNAATEKAKAAACPDDINPID